MSSQVQICVKVLLPTIRSVNKTSQNQRLKNGSKENVKRNNVR
ncbi:unnamed protein product [Brassica oleracea]